MVFHLHNEKIKHNQNVFSGSMNIFWSISRRGEIYCKRSVIELCSEQLQQEPLCSNQTQPNVLQMTRQKPSSELPTSFNRYLLIP